MSSRAPGFRPWSPKRRDHKKRARSKGSQPDPERHFGRGRGWGIIKGLLALVAALTLLAAGVVAFRFAKPRASEVAQPIVVVQPDLSAAALKEQWVGPPPRPVAEAFLRAETNEERLKWVRDPEAVKDLLAEWYTRPEREIIKLTTLKAMEVAGDNSRLNLGSEPEHAQYVVETGAEDWRFLSIVRTPAGGKVDFRAYIRQCSAPWPAILDGTAPQPDVRVFVAADNYHNFDYANETKWFNYTLSTPDCDEVLHLYVPSDSPFAREMPISMGAPLRRMFLRIRHTSAENLARRQFELVSILAPGWTE